MYGLCRLYLHLVAGQVDRSIANTSFTMVHSESRYPDIYNNR